MTLLKHLHSLEQPERLPAWLVTTAKRECWQRRRGAEYDRTTTLAPDAMPDDSPALDDAPEEILGRFEQYRELDSLLQQLDERCRRLLYYLYYDTDNPSYEEISRYLDIPIGAIGPTRARCLKKLRELMNESG
jgi:RNA polymerase sigma factor (sigma-70 family)